MSDDRAYNFHEALRALAQEHGYQMRQSEVGDGVVCAKFKLAQDNGGPLTRRLGKAMDQAESTGFVVPGTPRVI